MSNATGNRRKQPFEGQLTTNPENICHAQRIDLKFDQSGRTNHSRKHALELSLTEIPSGVCFMEADLNMCISNRHSVLEGSFVEYVQHKTKFSVQCKRHTSVFSLLPTVILPEMVTLELQKNGRGSKKSNVYISASKQTNAFPLCCGKLALNMSS